jgi:hypothetical protein
VRKSYEDRLLSLQRDVIARDTQIDEFNQRAQDYQTKIRDIQREFEEQSVAFNKKVLEKRTEVERLKGQVEKVTREV